MRTNNFVSMLTSGLQLAVFTLAAVVFSPAAWAEEELSTELNRVGHKIVYETFQDGNWELFMRNADGSDPVNLTRTSEVNELYPHASPDGTKVSFVVDAGEGASKNRSLWYMNIDGTGRKLVANNAREDCWKGDSSAIAYVKSEFKGFSYQDYATKGLYIYDLKTGKHRQHPNEEIMHLWNLCWSPDGKWFVASVHAEMGFKHAILAIEADGMKVFNLGIRGCRPDISPDGKRAAWGSSDWTLSVADLDLSGSVPKVTNARKVVTSEKPVMIYHIDWSPDGKYVTYTHGPVVKRLGMHPAIVGIKAEGWNICVADLSKTNRCVEITSDGKCNKEPDWVPVEKKK